MTETPTDLVRQASHAVRIAGTTRQADSISVDRSIATSLPAQVAGGGGVVKASGTVALGDPDDLVTIERDSPWFRSGGWPPARNAEITVDTTINDGAATRRFTGRVASVKSSTLDRVALDIEDYTDRLKVDFSHNAMLRRMPPAGQQSDNFLYVGLKADWVADKIFRQAGFYTTPPTTGTVALNVPAQGSMWPQVGPCTACTQANGTSTLPEWHPAPWGWAVANVLARYSAPNFGQQTLRGRTISMGMMCAPDHAGNARMDVTLGSATLRVAVLASRQIELRQNGTVLGTVTPTAGWTRVDVTWGVARGGARVRTDNGFTEVVSTTFGDPILDGAYARTEIQAQPAARVAGFVAAFVPNSYNGSYATSDSLNATIVPGSLLSYMRAMPSITSRDGLDLLGEISKALVISMWIDRDGHLWWVHPDRIRDQAPAADLTSTADLLDLAWEDTSDSARRSVTVSYDDPTIRAKLRHKLTAWEGPGDTLDQGEEAAEQIITPGSDTDWVEVAGFSPAIYATPSPSNPQAIPDFNRGIGSFPGGSHLNKDGDTPATLIKDGKTTEANAHEFPDLVRSLSKIGPAAWKLAVSLEDIADNYWVSLQQALDLNSAMGSRINQSWNGQKLPIIRCKAITEWEPAEYTSTITGPPQHDALDHDVGPWAGHGTQKLADWLARQVTDPAPILQDLPIVWRGDLQVGQVITVTEDVVYQVRLTCLVVGLREDHTRGSSTMRLTCRVISVERIAWTYDEMSRYWAAKGGDYDAQAASGKTYNQDQTPPADLASVLATPLIVPVVERIRDRDEEEP